MSIFKKTFSCLILCWNCQFWSVYKKMFCVKIYVLKNLGFAQITQKNAPKSAKLIALHAQKFAKKLFARKLRKFCEKNMVISWKPQSEQETVKIIKKYPFLYKAVGTKQLAINFNFLILIYTVIGGRAQGQHAPFLLFLLNIYISAMHIPLNSKLHLPKMKGCQGEKNT